MSSDIERVRRELGELGYSTTVSDTAQGETVIFHYTIESGPHEREDVQVGLSFQEPSYPEYPPHWVHVSPPINDNKGGVVSPYKDADGREWLAMSRPPGEIWDRLPTKTMRAYIEEHLRRVLR